jgi:Zn-dependent M28 family amino/carboxypeptidase
MKKLIYLIPIFIFGCQPAQEIEKNVDDTAAENAAKVYQVEERNVAETLRNLSSDSFEGREPGTPGIEKAAVFLEQLLTRNSIKPYFSTYRDRLTNFNKPTYNIVSFIEGNDPVLKKEFIVLGAHYDHLGFSRNPINGDKIYNGANDDASGVTAVTEIAKYFSSTKSNKRSLLFVFFSGEEKGLLGSKDLARKLKIKGLNLYTMLNFEMIGVPMQRSFSLYVTGYNKSNMAAKINQYAGKNIIGYLPSEESNQLFSRSDNYPFYNEFRVPSQTISSFDFQNFAFYHSVFDDISKMNTAHMTSVIKDMLPVIEKISNSSTKEIKLN